MRMPIGKLVVITICSVGAISGAIAGVYWSFAHDLPQIRGLESYKPSAITRIYSADQVLLAELFSENRDPVPFSMIPEYLKQAVIITEDRNFYTHSGVDLKGVVRAIYRDVMAQQLLEGASTITMQLTKTLFLDNKKTIKRKLKEAVLALHLERRFTKDELLGLYLNQIYFGSGAYGIKSAARIFFNKPVQQLTLAECALIAGMPKAPSLYSPLVNPDLALKRRNTVLRQMLETKTIDQLRFQQAMAEPIALSEQKNPSKNAQYFIDFILPGLETELGSAILYKGGLTIQTTLRFNLQQGVEKIVKNHMAALTARMHKAGLPDPNPECAVLSVDIASGAILCMVGGKAYETSSVNRAVSARRQPGSAFKPIVYAHAVKKGYPQNKLILDAPAIFPGKEKNTFWQPENFSKRYSGEITLRRALTHSKNVPVVRLMQMLGTDSVAHFAEELGIIPPPVPDLFLALGTWEMSLMELVSAYAVFPNRGNYVEPMGVMEVLDLSGRTIARWRPRKRAVMSRKAAAVVTDMMQGVILEGTGRKAKGRLQGPVAGKSGTTKEYKDAWFIGFSPTIATGVWVGNDDGRTLGEGETGARTALPIWLNVMQMATHQQPTQYFDLPDDVVKIRMDPVSGKLVSGEDPSGVDALFVRGTELTSNEKR